MFVISECMCLGMCVCVSESVCVQECTSKYSSLSFKRTDTLMLACKTFFFALCYVTCAICCFFTVFGTSSSVSCTKSLFDHGLVFPLIALCDKPSNYKLAHGHLAMIIGIFLRMHQYGNCGLMPVSNIFHVRIC